MVRASESPVSGEIASINISKEKGMKKTPVDEAIISENHGIEGDAHASLLSHRQVSLLSIASIKKMRATGLDVNPGDFAENITTMGTDLLSLSIGSKIGIGREAIGKVSQIGKECHTRCNIYHQAGDCVMLSEGIFVKILNGGRIKKGDELRVR
ncbi:MOSC domain-containing protein [Thermodesulfovibrionales bacterium]|nr:MOSC domain-containing protein [Thermodesulfovibrionales bacterium]